MFLYIAFYIVVCLCCKVVTFWLLERTIQIHVICSRQTGDDVLSEGGVRGEGECSAWRRAGMGGVRADTAVC